MRLSESESHSVVSDWLTVTAWNSPGRNTGVGSFSLLQGVFPTQGSKPRPLTLQADSLPTEPQGKPKNPGVSSLSLLQVIPDPGIEPGFPASQARSLPTELQGKVIKKEELP